MIETNKYKIIKAHPSFVKALEEIRLQRLIEGIDKKQKSLSRLTLGIARHPEFKNGSVKNDLIHAPLKDFLDDTSGQFQTFSLFTFIIVAFMAVILFAGLIYVMGLLNTTFENVGINNEINANQSMYVNLTQASQNTFGKVNESTQGLRLVALTLIFSLIMVNVLINFSIKQHPAYFFIYILIVILAILFAVPISNAFYDIEQTNIFNGTLNSFTGSEFILLNLPEVVLVMGILGAIIMFINIVKSPNEGGLS